MATRSAILRILAQIVEDTGNEAGVDLDSDAMGGIPSLLLTGIEEDDIKTIRLGPNATNQAVAWTDAVMVLLFSDIAIDLRLAGGESLVENVRFFGFCTADLDDGAHQSGILLSGRGDATATVKILIVEQPT